MQKFLRENWSNITVPVKSDHDVTETELKSHHLLLVGRPDSNVLVGRFRDTLPVTFGSRSFVVRKQTYAHPGSAVIVAAENPTNMRYSVVVFAGIAGMPVQCEQGDVVWRGFGSDKGAHDRCACLFGQRHRPAATAGVSADHLVQCRRDPADREAGEKAAKTWLAGLPPPRS